MRRLCRRIVGAEEGNDEDVGYNDEDDAGQEGVDDEAEVWVGGGGGGQKVMETLTTRKCHNKYQESKGLMS